MQPLASWDPTTETWGTTVTDLFSEHWVPYSATLPTSGSMRGGRLFALPTPAPPTAGPASSSSPGLPTPTSRDWKGANQRQDTSCLHGALLPTPEAYQGTRGGSQHPEKRRSGGHAVSLQDVTEHELLPTPRATDGTNGGPNQRGSSGDLMPPSAVVGIAQIPSSPVPSATTAEPMLLPTPAVNDMGAGKTPEQWDEWTAKMQAAHGNGNGHGKSLSIEAARLLPTPQAHDCETPKNPELIARMRARGHGVWNLNEVATHELSGAPMPPPSTAGRPSSAVPLPLPPSPGSEDSRD